LNRWSIAGLLIAFVGTGLLVWDGDVAPGTTLKDNILLGGILIFLASVSWAVHVVFSRPLIRKHGALKITCLTNMLIALPALPFMDSAKWNAIASLDGRGQAALALLMTLGTASVVAWNFAAGYVRPSLAGASLYVMPIITLVFGWLVLGEAVSTQILIAGLVIMAGVAISQFGAKSSA
jgi:drug/metabolite transporter (DMT)-like permease